MPRVDYSELVEALLNREKEKANELLGEVLPRLQEYLQVVMGAEKSSARECVQQAFLDVYEQICKNKIREHKYIFSYLLKACRHEYLRYSKHQHRFLFEEDALNHVVEPAEQISNLVDKERQVILNECLEELDEESRAFIIHFINKPDTTTKEASRHFNLTGANVRTKKSRITGRLHECYKRKADK
ncbi:MAG: sigma-70 family RNA polymerase sigma factor [Balneolaceae bacterium]